MRGSRSLAILALCLWLTAAGAQEAQPAAQPLPVGSATVEKIKGDVSVIVPQQGPEAAQAGMTLSPETIVETRKGSAVLQLEDGSQVLLKSNTRVVLKAPPESEGHFLDVLIGKIFAKVKKRLTEAPSFRMGTPTAVITVRGTEFEVEFTNKGVTRVEVHDGLVEVAGVGVQGPPVLVRPGFGTSVRPQRLPEPPRPFRETWEPGDGFGAQSPFGNRRDDSLPGSQSPGDRSGQKEPESESEPH